MDALLHEAPQAPGVRGGLLSRTSGLRGWGGVGVGQHSHHQLLDGGVFLALPARGRLLVDDLHADIVLGRHNTFEIWT